MEKLKQYKKIIGAALLLIIIALLLLISRCSKANDNSQNSSVDKSTVASEVVADTTKKEDSKEETSTKEETKKDTTTDTKKDTTTTNTKKDTTADGTHSFEVIFKNIDGTVLQKTTYKEGATPSYTGSTPAYADSTYKYTFTGWNKPIAKVTTMQIYTATYDKTLLKTTPTVTAPTAKTGLIYTGSDLELVSGGSTTGGSLQYKLGNGAYSTSVPTAKDAGTYTVYYKVVGDKTYADVAEASVSVTIAKVIVDVPTAKTDDLVYNSTEQIGVELPAGAKYTLTGNKATNAGDYTATAKLTDKTNYAWNLSTPTSDDQSISWSIAKIKVDVPVAMTGLTYNSSEQTGVELPADAKYTLTGTTKATDVGSYTATAILKDKSNYAWNLTSPTSDNQTISWSITKIKVAVPTAVTGLIYNATEQTGVAEGALYTLSGTAKATNAGTYTAIATLNEPTNYEWDSSTPNNPQNISWSIAQKPINVTADSQTSKVGFDLINPLTYTCDDSGAALSGTLKTDAKKDVVGDYEITQGTLTVDDANYSINFETGTYIVRKFLITEGSNKGSERVEESLPSIGPDEEVTLHYTSQGYDFKNATVSVTNAEFEWSYDGLNGTIVIKKAKDDVYISIKFNG